jgi:hypothetical protein
MVIAHTKGAATSEAARCASAIETGFRLEKEAEKLLGIEVLIIRQ